MIKKEPYEEIKKGGEGEIEAPKSILKSLQEDLRRDITLRFLRFKTHKNLFRTEKHNLQIIDTSLLNTNEIISQCIKA